MKRFQFIAISLLVLVVSGSAKADQLIGTYVAYISDGDKFNSKGERLTSPAAILRQDRANFHALGRGDALDDSDCYFGSRDNRATLERLLENGYISGFAADSIVNGNPLAFVAIYRDSWGDCYIQVALVD